MFDENLSGSVMRDLLAWIVPPPVFDNVRSKYQQGIWDEVWIPQVAEEGGWTVISLDLAKYKNQGGPLPALCLENDVTCVLMSGAINQRRNSYRTAILCHLWSHIEQIAAGPAGLRY